MYLYGEAAREESRKALPAIRAGEYEALPEKVSLAAPAGRAELQLHLPAFEEGAGGWHGPFAPGEILLTLLTVAAEAGRGGRCCPQQGDPYCLAVPALSSLLRSFQNRSGLLTLGPQRSSPAGEPQ